MSAWCPSCRRLCIAETEENPNFCPHDGTPLVVVPCPGCGNEDYFEDDAYCSRCGIRIAEHVAETLKKAREVAT